MPRTARASRGGICYHVINRGNGRAEVFHKDGDYDAFVRLLADAHERLRMRMRQPPEHRLLFLGVAGNSVFDFRA
jgi:REP element-mobilizing transposase RayT